MSEAGQKRDRRTARQRLFEAPSIDRMAPVSGFLVYAALVLWTLVVLFPIYWILITSFKTAIDVNRGPVYLPWIDFTPSLNAWNDLLIIDFGDTVKAYTNSLIISTTSTLLCITIGTMAAYALARFNYRPKFGNIFAFAIILIAAVATIALFKVDWRVTSATAAGLFFLFIRAAGRRMKGTVGNGDILFWMISQRILPPVVVVVPIYLMFQSVSLLDTQLALTLTYCVANLPIVVWLMHDFFATIPLDMEESAQIDGATRFAIFWDIVLPLTKNGLVATALLILIFSWNEYLLALFLSTSKAQTMPILVAAMNAGDRGILWWTMCVVIIVMIVPVVLLTLFLQRFIAKGLLLGAVKG
ncbi:MAG TPA: carbohydrate ABC transporter permease [Aestuariivirgaceae bacterium]